MLANRSLLAVCCSLAMRSIPMAAVGQTRESVKMALDTLRKNKMRSGLTILGILIGISTVILISSAINGLNSNIEQLVNSLGTNVLWVFHFDAVRPPAHDRGAQSQKADLRGRHGHARAAARRHRGPGLILPELSNRPGQCLSQARHAQDYRTPSSADPPRP